MATKLQQNNEPSKQFPYNIKDFRKACEIIKTWQFSDYDLWDKWFDLFEDNQGRVWSAQENNGKFWLFIDENKAFPLGKLQEYIHDFIEAQEQEKQMEIQEEREYREYRQELFRNYGVGRI